MENCNKNNYRYLLNLEWIDWENKEKEVIEDNWEFDFKR